MDSYEGTIQDQNDRITALDKLHFGFLGDFKSLQGSTVADRGKGEIQYDHQISGPLYDFARGSLERDDILDLTYRANMGPGLGYFLVKTDQMTWAVESGPGMQAQKYHEMGEDTTAQGVLLDHFNWQVTKTFHLFQNLEFDKDLPDIGGYRANYDVGFEAAISQKLHVRLTGNDRYNAQPVEGTKRNDLGIVTSLVWDF